jgi:N-acetylglucosamine-6-phosphate deacetylase
MDGADAMSGMARALLRHGVTSFLPTAVTAPLRTLAAFAATARSWMASSPDDGARPLGFNLEGPFLAAARKGAHEESLLVDPADAPRGSIEPLVEGLRVITIAPERPGAIELIARLADAGVAVALGHSAATYEQARAGYDAGAVSTTHVFNAMTGVHHRDPGLAVAALVDERVYVELIADGNHVSPVVWPLITRTKPRDRLLLVSDAIRLAGTAETRARVGDLDVEVRDGRVVLAGTSTLAGSIIALDSAVRNLVRAGVSIVDAVAAASRNPLRMLGVTDRGQVAAGQAADLVELDADVRVVRTMRAGRWFDRAG